MHPQKKHVHFGAVETVPPFKILMDHMQKYLVISDWTYSFWLLKALPVKKIGGPQKKKTFGLVQSFFTAKTNSPLGESMGDRKIQSSG